MIKEITLIFLLTIFCIDKSVAQQSYNEQTNFLRANSVWVFGENAGLDFNSVTPKAIATTVSGVEGRASVSDVKTGHLLFYTNGKRIWNRNQQLMPNGDDLYGNINISSVQGACIVPMVGSPNKYYVFSLLGITNITPNFVYPQPAGALYYSIVDINLDNGLGDVAPNYKNILLDSAKVLSEAMIAIPGNNCDIWLIAHEYGLPIFKAYHITKDGIDPNPIISNTGGQVSAPFLPSNYMQAYGVGSMTVSPNRHQLVISSYYSSTGLFGDAAGVLICKFNPQTGEVSNAIEIGNRTLTYGPAAFSPNGKFLYLPALDEKTYHESLYQYDVSTFDSLSIITSQNLIAHNLTSNFQKASLRLYRDSIYVSISGGWDSIGIITAPNIKGAGCNFIPLSIGLYKNTKTGYTFSNEVVYPLTPDTLRSIIMDTVVCSNSWNGINLLPQLVDSSYAYTWNTGSTASTLHIDGRGKHWVTYTNGCHLYVDTFNINILKIQAIIRVDTFTLSTTAPYKTYQWLYNGNFIPGATDSTYLITKNGDYQVIVSNEAGCIDTSDNYKVTNYTEGIDGISDLSRQVKVYPNPARDRVYIDAPLTVLVTLSGIDGRILKQVTNTSAVPLAGLASGMYLIQIRDQNNRLIKTEKLILQ